MRGRRIVCLGAALALICAASIASAEDESSLVSQIESVLREIKDKLDGVSSDSSSGDIDRAIDYARQVEDLADKLRSSDPQTDKGKTMANYYRDYSRKFQESAKYLRQMKDRQLQQQNDRLAERCHDSQQRLKDEINRYVEKNDPSGMSKIPDLAERAARDYQEPVRRDGEAHREMERWKDYAKNFSESDGYWSDVKYKLQGETDRIWDTWKQRYENTTRSENCGDIVKAKDNPIAVEAMKQLAGNDDIRKGLIKELDVQIKNIYEEIKDVDRRSDDGASRQLGETFKPKLESATSYRREMESWRERGRSLERSGRSRLV